MQNSHVRLGQLAYQRSSANTATHITVHVSHYIGEKGQAHLLSYFGNDAEAAAVTAAIQENHRFDLRFPDGSKQRIGFGADVSCYKGNLNLPQHKKSLRHVIAVSSWLRANGSAGRTFILHDEPHTQDLVWATLVSLLRLPTDPRCEAHLLEELGRDNKLVPIEGLGCDPAVIQASGEEMVEMMGHACAACDLPFPQTHAPLPRPA